MEKRVLFTELDDRGSHLRKEITPTAVVTDKRRFPTAQFWDANKTYDVIVADATSASDTLEKAEKNLNNEITRAQHAENALSDRIDDLLGIDAEDIEDLKQLVEDLDPETGILSVIEQKANSADLATVATSGSYNNLLDKPDLSLKANVEDISVITMGDPNGHDYVDLGLPSGTLWATMNVGANSETAYGNYYGYGKTTPHKFPEDPQYTGKEDPLDLSADVAHVIWGGGWHIPTKEQFEELIENTNYSWETISGSNIAKFTSKTDSSKYIYLPAAGYESGPSTYMVGNACFCWASNPYNNPDYPSLYQAYNFIANSDDIKVNKQDVSVGYPIRPVLDAQKILGKTVTDAEKAAWNAKANASDYYTKAEIDAMLQQITNA